MSVEFSCHACGRELKANERSIGRRVRCPECDTLLVIPDPAAGLEEIEEEPAAEDLAESLVEMEAIADVEPIELPEAAVEPPPLVPPVAPPPLAPPAGAPGTEAKRWSLRSIPRPQPRTSEEPPLLPPNRPHPEDLIDMTAMVDIVFFLLIFFLVTSLQALESVMDMPTPQAAEGSVSTGKSVADLENDPNFITVRIEDDDSIWIEDTQVFNDQELNLRLRAARREAGGPRSLLVIGDADASHGSAVRVFDAGAGAGVTGISLIVQEKSEASR
jgi:biopolymer transport protein ExbD